MPTIIRHIFQQLYNQDLPCHHMNSPNPKLRHAPQHHRVPWTPGTQLHQNNHEPT